MTPLHLQILLWTHTRPTRYAEYEPGHANSSVVKDYTESLIHNELIERDPQPKHPSDLDYTASNLRTTDRGRAYVEMLCNLPLPVCKWVQP